MDSVAHRQYYCGGSEELAIPATAGSRLAGKWLGVSECLEQLGVLCSRSRSEWLGAALSSSEFLSAPIWSSSEF